jgi:hypothetical protein
VGRLAVASKEMKEMLARAQRVRLQSVFLRLDLAIAKCQMAKRFSDAPVGSLVTSAQQTFDEVDGYVWRYKLDHEYFDQITAKLERLKFEIGAAKDFLKP